MIQYFNVFCVRETGRPPQSQLLSSTLAEEGISRCFFFGQPWQNDKACLCRRHPVSKKLIVETFSVSWT